MVLHQAPGWSGPGLSLQFYVNGIPAPQGSKRYLGRGSAGKGIMVESSNRVAPWRADVRAAAEQALDDHPPAETLWREPVLVEMIFHLPRPKSHYGIGRNADVLKPSAPRYPASTPDLDKLVRAILDALTSVVWADDGHVVGIYTAKLYAHAGQAPGATVHIKEG